MDHFLCYKYKPMCYKYSLQKFFLAVRSLKSLLFASLTISYSYAPWCPACQNLQPEWESFAEWGEDLEVKIAKVDVTEQTGTITLTHCVSLLMLLMVLTYG